MLRLSGALPIGALVVAGCATAYGEAPGGDAGAGADSGADAVEQPPGEDVSVVTSCGAAAPNPETVGFAGIAITNLTSTKTHVHWLAGRNKLQRIRLAPRASVETIFEAQEGIAAFVATPDFVVYAVEGGSFAVANVAGAQAPVSVGNVGPPFATGEAAVFAVSGDIIYRSSPPSFFGGLISRPGVTAMAGNATSLFYLAPVQGMTTNGVSTLQNVMATQNLSPTILSAPSVNPTQLALDDTNVYMVDRGNRNLFKVPHGGGAPVTLVSAEPELGRIVVKNQQIFYSTLQGIKRISSAGGTCAALLTNSAVYDFTVAGAYVYFAVGANLVRVHQ